MDNHSENNNDEFFKDMSEMVDKTVHHIKMKTKLYNKTIISLHGKHLNDCEYRGNINEEIWSAKDLYLNKGYHCKTGLNPDICKVCEKCRDLAYRLNMNNI